MALLKVTLNKQELAKVLPHFTKATQAYRITAYLARNQGVATGKLCAKTSTGNISEIVRSICNPKLQTHGLMIRCEKPLEPFKNQFGQDSNQFAWSLFRVSEEQRRA